MADRVIQSFRIAAACGALLAVAPVLSGAEPETSPPPAKLLAGAFVRTAHQLLELEELTPAGLDMSIRLMLRAAELQPDDVELWRSIRAAAELGEREELRRQAVAQIVQLDGQDEFARLQRINDAMEQYQSVEERLAAYEQLLAPANREHLGPAVTSRLATDLALLYRRQGDPESFGRWLAEAVAIDPSNREAAALAAGYFRINVTDPCAEAELLTTLLMADPTSDITQIALAQLLLDNGAYGGAERFYRLAVETRRANRQRSAGDLLADLAIAQWGGGNVEGALQTIQVRQAEIDDRIRDELKEKFPRAMAADLAQVRMTIDPTLSTVRTAIFDRLHREDTAQEVNATITSYQGILKKMREQTDPPVDPKEMLPLLLEAAWIGAWLGDDPLPVQTFVAEATKIEPLTPQARARFAGWLALKLGHLDKAAEFFAISAKTELGAELGLGLALYRSGNQRDGAALMLEVVRKEPGTVMGIWAADLLTELIGQRPGPTPLAVRLEQLADAVPTAIDALPRNPTQALRVTVIPTRDRFNPYEPVIVNVELLNTSTMPLGIDDDGPIRSQVILEPKIGITRAPQVGQAAPLVLDIRRRLRLTPRQKLVIPVDLRRGQFADTVNLAPVVGAGVQVRAMTNFGVGPQGKILTLMLGSETTSETFRVDGLRTSREWMMATTAKLQNVDEQPDLINTAMLGYLVGAGLSRQAALEDVKMMNTASAVLAQTFTRLDPMSQAWLLSVLPISSSIEPILAIARTIDNKWVRSSYLLYRVFDLGDPMLDAAKRGADEDVRVFADVLEEMMIQRKAHIDSFRP